MTVNSEDRRCGLYDHIFHLDDDGNVIGEDSMMIHIPYNAQSSKNAQMIVYRGGLKMGTTITSQRQAAGLARCYGIKQNKKCDEYERNTKSFFLENKEKFQSLVENLPKPLIIGVYYMRKTMHEFDYHNVVQHLADLISEPSGAKKKGYGWVKDDNMKETIYLPLGYCVTKYNGMPKEGVIIKILSLEKYMEFIRS